MLRRGSHDQEQVCVCGLLVAFVTCMSCAIILSVFGGQGASVLLYAII